MIQDEQVSKWRQDGISGSKIQHSILGRVKAKLISSDKTVLLDQWFPTTKYCRHCGSNVELELKDRTFKCPNCKTKEDRDIHSANNMIWFYLRYNKLDRSGTDQTSIKGPVKFAYNNLYANLLSRKIQRL